jgi:leucyl-tRNA synthetase
LAPICPFVTEEIWKNLGNKKSIHLETWPKFDQKKTIENTVNLPIQINGKLRGTIEVGIEENENEVMEKVKKTEVYKNWIEGKEIRKIIYLKGRILNIVI